MDDDAPDFRFRAYLSLLSASPAFDVNSTRCVGGEPPLLFAFSRRSRYCIDHLLHVLLEIHPPFRQKGL